MKNGLVSVRDYARMIFRRKWALVVPGLLGILMAPVLWVSVPPKYRADALVRRKDLAVLQSAPGAVVDKNDANVSVAALRVEILTWNNLERVIRQVNLDKKLDGPAEWQQMYSKLRDAITIDTRARGRGIDLIEIAVIHKDAQLAAEIANAVADNYVEHSQRITRTQSQQAVEFLKKGVEEYRKKLNDLEERIRTYKEENFANLPQVRESILATLRSLRTEKTARTLQLSGDKSASLQSQKTAQQLQLTGAKSRLKKVKKQLKKVEKTVEGEVTMKENPLHNQLQKRLETQKMALTELRASYTDKHPKVKKTKKKIERIKERLEETPQQVEAKKSVVLNPEYQELKMKQRKLEQDIQAHKASLNQIKARIAANQEQLKSLMDKSERLSELKRQKRQSQHLYEQYRDSLISARTRLEVESGQYGTETEMVSRALVPRSPYRLERMKFALAAIAGGMCVGVGLLFGLEFTDRSFRSVEDAHAYLGIPVLGSVPTIESPEVVRRRRERRMMLLVWGLVATVVVAGGLLAAWYFYPRVLRREALWLYELGKNFMSQTFQLLR
jgi:polysaccharide chain length determinant protein (PEP-CTERM system associated)